MWRLILSQRLCPPALVTGQVVVPPDRRRWLWLCRGDNNLQGQCGLRAPASPASPARAPLLSCPFFHNSPILRSKCPRLPVGGGLQPPTSAQSRAVPPSPPSLLWGTGTRHTGPGRAAQAAGERPGRLIPVPAAPEPRGAPGTCTGSAGPRGFLPRGSRRAHAWRRPVLPPRGPGGPACAPLCGQCPEPRVSPGSRGLAPEPAVSPGQWGFELLIFGLICKRLNEIEGEQSSTLLK